MAIKGIRKWRGLKSLVHDADLVGRLVGDLLVRVPSSSGPALKTSQFAIHTRRYGGILHHQMQNHPAVYEQLRCACSGE